MDPKIVKLHQLPGDKNDALYLIMSHTFFGRKEVSCICLKKIKVILFLLSFLLANSGMVVSAHWCAGKLTAISFFSARGLCACAQKSEAMKPGCCKDQQAVFQADNDLDVHGMEEYKESSSGPVPTLAPGFEITHYPILISCPAAFSLWPAGCPKQPRYLQNRVFRI